MLKILRTLSLRFKVTGSYKNNVVNTNNKTSESHQLNRPQKVKLNSWFTKNQLVYIKLKF